MNHLWNFPNKLSMLAFSVVLLFITAGCASTHVDGAKSTTTAVALNAKNYRLIKPGATGSSYGFRFLCVLPLSSPHFSTARADLYASVDEPLAGKAVALANEMEDKSTLFLILFSIPKVTITADVIEFVDKDEAKATVTAPAATPTAGPP